MRNKNRQNTALFYISLLSVFWFLGSGVAGEGYPETIEKGRVIENVVCRLSVDESYLLYLPSAYNEQQKWPVLFTFDPGGRVTVPAALFKAAAEKYGYILVCPTHVRNGPGEPIVKAMRAVWLDVSSRFAVDKDRLYAAGFSGGSRVATFFNQAIHNPVLGIIACGAGLSQSIQPHHIKNILYYGLVGYGDFNYSEMVALEKTLAAQNTPHRFVFFPGPHVWPTEEYCLRAVEWLEIMALKTGTIPKDTRLSFINEIFEKETTLAQNRAATGEEYYAASDYEGIIRLFDGLKPVENLKKLARQLLESKGFKSFQKDERHRLNEEQEYLKHIYGGFAYLNQNVPLDIRLGELKQKMEIPRLLRQLKKKNLYDAALAGRLLFNIAMKCDGDVDEYVRNKDFKRAVITMEIGIEAGVDTVFTPYFLYQRGVQYAREGNSKKALKLLQEAVDKGFKNYKAMEKDEYLQIIRDTPQFQQLLEKMKK